MHLTSVPDFECICRALMRLCCINRSCSRYSHELWCGWRTLIMWKWIWMTWKWAVAVISPKHLRLFKKNCDKTEQSNSKSFNFVPKHFLPRYHETTGRYEQKLLIVLFKNKFLEIFLHIRRLLRVTSTLFIIYFCI